MKLGVKAHWKDADIMARFGTELMEIHLEPRDLVEHMEKIVGIFSTISDEHGIELIVHNQEYWFDGKDYHLVDLASLDETKRQKAIEYTNKALDLADRVGAMYLVVHPGGIFPYKVDNEKPLARLKESLKDIHDDRILLENMPWIYIMRTGEIWRSNICIEPVDFFEFSDLVGGVTLDICHAFLATKEGDNDHVLAMKKTLGKMIKHVHASDARPPHHEGLQIGEGLVNFEVLKDFQVGIIPEIIDGHKNEGEGFGIALERLKNLK
ncbi:MAG: sugar phosphate isomerase/epimerase [Thermoplasmata archaeon]|nr:sugar phosphate isomerase/epimerase [Thermoplasmata archaeon]